jgi:hypothetical protein
MMTTKFLPKESEHILQGAIAGSFEPAFILDGSQESAKANLEKLFQFFGIRLQHTSAAEIQHWFAKGKESPPRSFSAPRPNSET